MGDGELQQRIGRYLGAVGARTENDIPINLDQVHDDLLEVVAAAKRDFPKRTDFPYETSVEVREDDFYRWFVKWFGE